MIKILVKLEVRDFEALEQFERFVSKIMTTYQGRIVEAFETHRSDNQGQEVHLLEFPDHESFENYRQDKRHSQFASLREKAISKTEVIQSTKLKNYE